MMNKKLLITGAFLSSVLMGCSDDAQHTYVTPSVDTPDAVYVGKSSATEIIRAVYGAGSADVTVDIDGTSVELMPEGTHTLYGHGEAAGTTRVIKNSRAVDESLGVHATRSLVFITSGEEHTNALSYSYAKDVRGGVNLISETFLANWENNTNKDSFNETIPVMPEHVRVGDSWGAIESFSPGLLGNANTWFPTLLSTNATAPYSGIEGCSLFWYRQHYFWAGVYYPNWVLVYHKAGSGVVEAIFKGDANANGELVPSSGASVSKEQVGPGVVPEFTLVELANFSWSIATTATTHSYNKLTDISIVKADDPSNPTGYDWVTINIAETTDTKYKVQIKYPLTGYNVNFNTLTDPVYAGAYAPIFQIDINNDGIWDYVADKTSDLNIRTEYPLGAFDVNEPKNHTPIFVSGNVRSTDGTGVAIATDPYPSNFRDVYLKIAGFNELVHNGAPYVDIEGLKDNKLPDMHVDKRIPVRHGMENLADNTKSFDFIQYELVWATTEAGVIARENVVSYLDESFVTTSADDQIAYIPAQTSPATVYFQFRVISSSTPAVTSNPEVLNILTPIYSVNVLAGSNDSGIAPTPQVVVSPSIGSAPLVVSVSTKASSDKDGVIERIMLDTGDGNFNDNISGGTYTYEYDGEYKLELFFIDNDGNTSSYTKNIIVSSYGSVKIINSHDTSISEFYMTEKDSDLWGYDRLSGSLYPTSSTGFGDIFNGEYDYWLVLSDGRELFGRVFISGGSETVIDVNKFLIP
jgi:PKD domain